MCVTGVTSVSHKMVLSLLWKSESSAQAEVVRIDLYFIKSLKHFFHVSISELGIYFTIAVSCSCYQPGGRRLVATASSCLTLLRALHEFWPRFPEPCVLSALDTLTAILNVFRKMTPPWLLWLSGLSAGLQSEGSPVQSPVKAHACIVGQVPSRGRVRGNHTLIFFLPSFLLMSLFFSFPSTLSKNK